MMMFEGGRLGLLQEFGSSFGAHHTKFSPIANPEPNCSEDTRAFGILAEPVNTEASTTSLTPIVKF